MRAAKLCGVGAALVLLTLTARDSDPIGLAQADCTVTVQPGQSIQSAINEAKEGAVICLAAGTYEENIEIKKGLTLRGLGTDPEDVRIVGVRWGHPVMRIESDSEIEVTIERLTAAEARGVVCAEDDPRWICPDGIQALGKAKVTIKGTQVSRNSFDGLDVMDSASVSLTDSTVSGNWDGLSVGDSASVSLTDSTVSDNRYNGLVVWGSAQVSLTNSTVSGNGYDGLRVRDSAQVSLTGSTVSGNWWSGLLVWGSAQVTIKNNTITGNKYCGIWSSSDKPVQGEKNIIIDNGADLCGNLSARLRQPLEPEDPTKKELSFPGPYPTLQHALDALAPGGTITIAAGEHRGGVTIWKPLKFKGAGQERTKLVGAVSLIDEARGVEIEGVTITGSSFEGVLAGGHAEATITGSAVSGNEGSGLFVWGSAQVSLTGSTASDNTNGLWVMGSASVSLTGSTVSDNGAGAGLVVIGSAQVSLTDSTVSGNWAGLAVWDSASVSLTGSTVSGNGYGLEVWGSASVSLTGSTVSGNGAGLVVMGSAQVNLTGSTVSDNWGDGLEVRDSAQVSLTGSTVSNNGVGLWVEDFASVGLTNSTVSDNEDGLWVEDSASVSLTNSTVSGNEWDGLEVGGSAKVEVRSSTIEGNGTDEDCKKKSWLCNGITVLGESQTTITESKIRGNADWGVGAALKKCGDNEDDFTGTVEIDEKTVIEGNNRTGNQDGMGNPGNHRWNRPDVPDGQVCLP